MCAIACALCMGLRVYSVTGGCMYSTHVMAQLDACMGTVYSVCNIVTY